MQADTHAEQQRRDAERAEMAGKAEARIASQLIDIALLLDAGKRDEASTVLTKLLAEAKAPQVQALLQQALNRLDRKVDLAVDTE